MSGVVRANLVAAVHRCGVGFAFSAALIALGEDVSANQAEVFGVHNLDAEKRSGNEVCAFCHTPNRNDAATPGWRQGNMSVTFDTYDTASRTGRIEVREGVSFACLTCHDGTQAMDVAPDLVLTSAASGRMPATPRIDHEHPVGVVYGGFRGRLQGYATETLESEIIDGRRSWWIEIEPTANGIRDKSDIILYGRDVRGEEQPHVECPTCHDPHANANSRFLRAPNDGSAICYACHTI